MIFSLCDVPIDGTIVEASLMGLPEVSTGELGHQRVA
jgi:hypothetical protein